jgi:predicted dehydrogenase
MENSTRVSRRGFLKSTAVAGAAAAVASVARPGYVAESGELKIGLIGCGGRGKDAAQQALRACEIAGVPGKLVALADVLGRAKGAVGGFTESRNKFVRENTAIKPDMIFDGLDAYKQLLATDVSYVILATHPGFRPMHFEAAVAAGKQIFTEKPVGTDPAGIARFMKAAKESETKNLSVVAGTQRRHERSYVKTIAKIHNGEIGDILAAYAYWQGGPVINQTKPRPAGMGDLEWQIRDWYSHLWICGDNIVEQHVHNLDIINWVMQSHPVSCSGNGGRAWKRKADWLGNIWDNFSVDYIYPNGVHMSSYCRHLADCPSDVSELVVGTKGKSRCNDKGEADPSFDDNAYVQEHVDFVNSVTGKGKHWNQAMEVAETTFTGILGRESAYQGRPLKWDELLNSGLSYFPKELSFEAKIPLSPVPHPGVPKFFQKEYPVECL